MTCELTKYGDCKLEGRTKTPGTAYEDGEEARSLGWSKKECPYPEDPEFEVFRSAWLSGWKNESRRGY